MCFYMLSRLDVAHACDRQTDRSTDGRKDRTAVSNGAV